MTPHVFYAPAEIEIKVAIIGNKQSGIATITMGLGQYPTPQEVDVRIKKFADEEMPTGFRLMTKQEYWDYICSDRFDGHYAMPGGQEFDQLQLTQAASDVLAERQRQISAEGWTPEHDAAHDDGQLAGAASCYAQHVNARSWVIDLDDGPEVYRTDPAPDNWPWDESWWKPTTPRRDAIKACALLLAEIERFDRTQEGQSNVAI